VKYVGIINESVKENESGAGGEKRSETASLAARRQKAPLARRHQRKRKPKRQ
jgi:hypothetical protein